MVIICQDSWPKRLFLNMFTYQQKFSSRKKNLIGITTRSEPDMTIFDQTDDHLRVWEMLSSRNSRTLRGPLGLYWSKIFLFGPRYSKFCWSLSGPRFIGDPGPECSDFLIGIGPWFLYLVGSVGPCQAFGFIVRCSKLNVPNGDAPILRKKYTTVNEPIKYEFHLVTDRTIFVQIILKYWLLLIVNRFWTQKTQKYFSLYSHNNSDKKWWK